MFTLLSFGCMLAVRTPGAPQTARVVAACNSAFPFERQGRLLRSRSISGPYSRSLRSGLQPPCLRFAVAVTGRHARLGSRLLARLCRGRHLRRQTSTRLQGATLIKPDVRIPASGFPAGFTSNLSAACLFVRGFAEDAQLAEKRFVAETTCASRLRLVPPDEGISARFPPRFARM